MKRFFLFFYFLFFFANIFAQFSIGFTSGINFPKVKYEDNYIQENFAKPYVSRRIAVNGGLLSEYFFSKTLGIQSELIFSPKGFKYKGPNIVGNQKYYYSQISIGGKIENKIDKKKKYYLMLSPYASFWFYGTREENEIKDRIYFSGIDLGWNYEYNRWDAGIIISGGLKTETKNDNSLVYNLKIEYGMIPNSKEIATATFNRVISLNFGYLFDL